ncbi:unnamed protein product, partial [Rotaria sordida]
MKPQIVRFVLPSNKDFQSYNLSQGANTFQTIHPVVHHQKSFSLQLVNGTTSSATAVAPSRVFITSTPPTFNLYDEVTAQKSNNSSINNCIHGTILNPSSSVVGIPINKSCLGEVIPTTNMCLSNSASMPQPTTLCKNKKTSDSPCPEKTQRNTKQSNKRLKLEETSGKLVKRCKNWSEEETKTFIAIWSENYSRLMSSGSRNASIYQSMADELNKILQRRSLTGERPYNDDSLLTDSMKIGEQVLQDIENIPPVDLNSTQISELVDDLVPSLADTEETNSFTDINPNHLGSSSNVDTLSKSDTSSVTNSSKPKKTAPEKKRRISEIKVNLVQDLIGKIESANENASRSEVKTNFECQRFIQKYRRDLTLRNFLITSLFIISERTLITSRRLIWCYKRSGRWWTEIVPLMNDQQFKNNFRIQRSTFGELVRLVGPHVFKNDTNYRAAIPVEKRIACALYALGSSSELRTISNLFGIGVNTTGLIVHEFCNTIIDLFLYKLIKFPSTDAEIYETMNGFLTKFGYPLCLGSLDGTHIQIKPPIGAEPDYYNYKKFHSVIMLAAVNSNLMFTYINVGAPGRCNDSSVYSRSTLYDVIQNSIYKKYYLIENNVTIYAHLIADSAFPLDATLIKPYIEKPNMSRKECMFNYRLSRARSTVERAFGIMKNRFRCIHRKLEYELDNSVRIIKAIAILHNICIISGDNSELDWDIPHVIYKKPSCNSQTTDGNDIRQALTEYFVKNP